MVHHTEDYAFNLGRTIFIVFSGCFHERKSIDVTDIRDSIRSKQVEAANALFKLFADQSCVFFFL